MENKKLKRIFLGGTCNNSTWREHLIPLLKIDYYNPVVKDWTPECQEEEIKQREECDYCLYIITPLMTGVYSIAEVVDDSNKRPKKTLFYFSDYEEKTLNSVKVEVVQFNKFQLKSLQQVGKMVRENGGKWFETMDNLVKFLNTDIYKEDIPTWKRETLRLDAPEGTKVRVITKDGEPWNGYESEQKYVKTYLNLDETYTVQQVVPGSYSSDVYLKERVGLVFNTVSFYELK